MQLDVFVILSLAVLIALLLFGCLWLAISNSKHRQAIREQQSSLIRFQGVADAEAERLRILGDIERRKNEQLMSTQQA